VKESQRWLRHAFCDPWCSLQYNVPSPLPLQAIAHGQTSLPAPDDDGIDPANVHFLDSLAEASLVVRVCRQGHTLVQAVRLIGHYLVFIAGKLLGERSFWAVWIDLQTRRPAFRGSRRLVGVVRFEATKYHTVAATDDRPEGRGLSLVFDQILRSSSARRMTRSIAS